MVDVGYARFDGSTVLNELVKIDPKAHTTIYDRLHKLSHQMSSEPNRVVFHGSKVLLPDLDEFVEASIVVDATKERSSLLSKVL
jgi:hypothetical protein